ncbi:MAG: WD40 repeat domain-containing protein [bacterium]|nr:WD40 repeat domain-containing protein [bacterium]
MGTVEYVACPLTSQLLFASAIGWNPSGTRLAVGSEQSIQVWEQPWNAQQAALSLTVQALTELQYPWDIVSLDWNAAGTEILGVVPNRVHIWNSQTGQLIRTIDPDPTPMLSARWSDNGARLASDVLQHGSWRRT